MNKELLKDIEEDILKYYKRFGAQKTIDKFEKEVLDVCIPELSYFFVSNIQGANFPEHLRVIYYGDDYDTLYDLARNYLKIYKYKSYLESVSMRIADKGSISLNYKYVVKPPILYVDRYTQKKSDVSANIQSIIDSNDYYHMIKLLCANYEVSLNDCNNDFSSFGNKFTFLFEKYKGFLYERKYGLRENISLNFGEHCNLSEDNIEKISHKILDSDDFYYSYVYALIVDGKRDISDHLEKIVDSKDALYNYMAFKNISTSLKGRHLDVVVRSKDYNINLAALRLISRSNYRDFIDYRSKIVENIIESKNPEYLFALIKLPSFNRSRLVSLDSDDAIKVFNGIAESKDAEYNYRLIDDCPKSINFKKHAKIVIDGDNVNYIYQLAIHYSDKLSKNDLNIALHKIADSKNPEYNFMIAKKYLNCDENIKAIIESANAEYCYKTALEIKNDYMDQLEDVVIKSGNAEFNYLYALNIKGCNVDKHLSVIIESKDPKYNYLAIQNIEGAPVEEHMNVVLESGDFEYIDQFDRIEEVKSQGIVNKIKTIGAMVSREEN